ncbi:SlyX protein [Salinivibrio sp. MA351]|jgi:SlyX protein|uniref:Protein SlyX homolog n=1 Tax=Salinivibrio costicola subsp. alcaliphilus TaxID=272773 RepID=A0ABX3KVD1_SALCS|nr:MULTISPECIES: SlyX family protein [Salinivibrio]NUY55253.1 SlyX family protein [Salinivibrio sp. EAGSL]OOE89913.1 SlyX protein [Salinivibrio sp. AR640]OOE91246.1 SlyX protein [Salinivibrio sp. AR647]OOF00811.1 SlyX protein [Salinivibrio sp. MA351]OOF03691.1 SlyX protein [Salinivibrio sp. MA440]
MSEIDKLQQQIDDLEYKVAFQEDTIDQLNTALTRQQGDIERMTVQIQYLVSKLQHVEPENIASQAEETPPPHY